MKKIIAGTVFMAASALASAHGPAGCGVGTTYIFQDANQWYEHVLAVTTNGSLSNTASMTSGLLNCSDANGPLKLARLFIDQNMDQLAADTARGEGETLAALAEVIGIQAQDQAAFNKTMQANFDALFSIDGSSAETYEAMTSSMAQDAELQKYLG